eukprot:TRINITY_DN34933_c0_g1_i1.p1 TRINITY_DN34933_c0_g1~~TRINITY_DN34933_c0_g1_i1.p1  ORF type:complete len:429 (+),score=59.10 TRINITY_DN34933_c0_g1_i1:189-1475(+)
MMRVFAAPSIAFAALIKAACGALDLATASVAAASVISAGASGVSVVPQMASVTTQLPFEISADIDLYNQATAVKYFEEPFYVDNRNALPDAELKHVETLRHRAKEEPVLALAAAQVLYMFAWYRSNEVVRENIVDSAHFFDVSIQVGGCDPAAGQWLDRSCDIRYMHAILLYNWLSETEGNAEMSRAFLRRSHELLTLMRAVPKYESVSSAWTSPLSLNFNSVIFPKTTARPIWDTHSLPIGTFLEDSHHIFKAELEAILADPRDLFNVLMTNDRSREHLGTPGGWDTVRIVRYHHWYDLFCEMAPLTCQLIRTRAEIMNCTFMNVNIVRLHPGAHLKPHFGNGPRLTGHLSLIAPEPLHAGMSVGTEKVLWVEGRAVIFDDTFPHCVSHWGKLPRYVMLIWFCHPCDGSNAHEQTCPEQDAIESLRE